eukprot:jgi/Botrbrau1/18990/Bobra.0100s0025.1
MKAAEVFATSVILWVCLLAIGLPVNGDGTGAGGRKLHQTLPSIYTPAPAPGPGWMEGAASLVQGVGNNLVGRKLRQDFGVPVPPAEAPVPESQIGSASVPSPSVGQAVRNTAGRRLLSEGATQLTQGVNNLVGRRLQVDFGAPGPGLLGHAAPSPAPVAAPIGSAFQNVGSSISNGAQNVGQGIRNAFG